MFVGKSNARVEAEKLKAEVVRLRAALEPFAKAADVLKSFPDETRLDLAPITLGDLRKARAALQPKEGEK